MGRMIVIALQVSGKNTACFCCSRGSEARLDAFCAVLSHAVCRGYGWVWATPWKPVVTDYDTVHSSVRELEEHSI